MTGTINSPVTYVSLCILYLKQLFRLASDLKYIGFRDISRDLD